jgi:hypothetical protein
MSPEKAPASEVKKEKSNLATSCPVPSNICPALVPII